MITKNGKILKNFITKYFNSFRVFLNDKLNVEDIIF